MEAKQVAVGEQAVVGELAVSELPAGWNAVDPTIAFELSVAALKHFVDVVPGLTLTAAASTAPAATYSLPSCHRYLIWI